MEDSMRRKDELSRDEQDILLGLAREALSSSARGQMLPKLDLKNLPPRLQIPGASFVTLMKAGALRGCIGTLTASIPLAEDVRQHTIAAARYDYRFSPVQEAEVEEISIEISVLSKPEPLTYRDPDHLLHMLRPGIDGVIVTEGNKRATFLPQVWEKVDSVEHFLDSLCQKAGLQENAWQERVLTILTYQVIHFEEQPPTSS